MKGSSASFSDWYLAALSIQDTFGQFHEARCLLPLVNFSTILVFPNTAPATTEVSPT